MNSTHNSNDPTVKERGMRRKPNNGKMHSNNGGGNNPRRRYTNNRGSGGGGENNTGKIKNVSANRDKYLNMARDAMASGDRVEAENYLQHAEHYYRVLSVLQEEDNRNRPERNEQQNADAPQGASEDDSDDAKNNGNQSDDDSDDSLALAS